MDIPIRAGRTFSAADHGVRVVIVNTTFVHQYLGGRPGLLVAIFVTKPLAMFLVPGLKPEDPLNFAAVVGVPIVNNSLTRTAGISQFAEPLDSDVSPLT